MHRYQSEKIQQLLTDIFVAYGWSPTNSAKMAQVMTYTDLHGIRSHGIQRLAMYDRLISSNQMRVNAEPEIVHATDVSAVIDAHFGFGALTGVTSMQIAIDKAKAHGVGIVATRHSTHYGIAGYYANMAADAGLIGMSATNSRPGMVPTNATKAYIGTNPLAFAVPAHPHNFIFDAATTTVPQGKVEIYRKLGHDLPAGWAIRDGVQPVTDHTDSSTLDALRDADAPVGLTPLGGAGTVTGGHKGYGLGLIVEVFTGILSMGDLSAEITADDPNVGPSQSFIAINPEIFGDPEAMSNRFSDYLQNIRELPAVPGQRIRVHGDLEADAAADNLEYGIPIDDKTVQEVRTIAERLAVNAAVFDTPVHN